MKLALDCHGFVSRGYQEYGEVDATMNAFSQWLSEAWGKGAKLSNRVFSHVEPKAEYI